LRPHLQAAYVEQLAGTRESRVRSISCFLTALPRT
jgi:hypothetical protein